MYDHRTMTEVWEKAAGRRRNDYLDCESYSVAGNFYLVHKNAKADKAVERRVQENNANPGVERPARRPSLIGGVGNGNWITKRGR